MPHRHDFRVDHHLHDHRLDVAVREIMTPGTVAIDGDASLDHVYRAMSTHGVHAILVMGPRDEGPLGWVTARGLLDRLAAGDEPSLAHQAIDEPAVRIGPSDSAAVALAELRRPGTTHLVVCRGIFPQGVVTDLDLLALFAAH